MIQKFRDFLSFGAGILIGLLAGGIAANWIAAESGEEHRNKLKDAVLNFEKETQARIQQMGEQLQNTLPGVNSDSESSSDS